MAGSYTLPDILTNEEIERALKLYLTAEPGTFAARCDETIVTPVLARIEAKLGQPMNARYIAYSIEHVFNQTGVRK